MFAGPSALTWPCGRWAALPQIGKRRIDQQIEPVRGLLDLRTALGPDHAVILAAGHQRLHVVRHLGEHRPLRGERQVVGLVGIEIDAAHLRGDIALALVGAQMRGQSFGVTARRRTAVEIDGGKLRDRARHAIHADREAVDLLEAARSVGEEALARFFDGSAGARAFFVPGIAVGLDRHVGQWIEAVLRVQRDLIDRLVVGALARFAERAALTDIAVRRRVELSRIGLERMRRELLHVDRRRRCEALRAQAIKHRG